MFKSILYFKYQVLPEQYSWQVTVQPAITYSTLTIEILEQGVKYAQS